MKELTKRSLSVLVACLVAATAITGAVTYAQQEDSPVGEANAVVCGGLCIAGVAGASAGVGIAAGAVAYSEFVEDPKLNNIKKAESFETKLTIHQILRTQQQNNEVLGDSFSNFLNDSQAPATLLSKNNYIRTLNNNTGLSLSQARTRAIQRNDDYYSKKQVQLFKSWESSLRAARAAQTAAQNDSGVSDSYLSAEFYASYGDKIGGRMTTLDHDVTVQLANGSSYETKAVGFRGQYDPGNGYDYGETVYYYPGHFGPQSPKNPGYDAQTMTGITVAGHKDADGFLYLDFATYEDLYTKIDQNRIAVRNRIENFVDSTYSGYQAGEISNADLVDPYLAAREYSPEGNYGTFTTRSLTAMGYNGPANLSNTKRMRISVNGTTKEGVLLSDGLPAGNRFEVGETYNASKLAGRQFIQTNDSTTEIADTFRIESVYGMDGEQLNQSAVQYRNISYQTSNLDEYKQQLQNLREAQAEINARQANLTDTGSTAGFDFDGLANSLPFGGAGLAVGLVALLAIALLSRS